MPFIAYLVHDDGKLEVIDMKGVKLETLDQVRDWLFISGKKGEFAPGFHKTHPELIDRRISVMEGEPVIKSPTPSQMGPH